MGWLNRLFTPAPQEEKASAAAPLLVMGNDPQVVWSKRDYATFSKEAYQMNVVAYQAINKVAEAVAMVKWSAWRGDEEITEHPMLDLLSRPNLQQSSTEFLRSWVGYLLISGNAYIESVDVGGEPKELHVHRPDRMSIKPSPFGVPSAFLYKVGQQTYQWDVDPNTGDSDIQHTKLFHPTDDWYGLSPIEAGAFAVDQHNESAAWMQALLQNSARPSGALVATSEGELSPEQFERLKEQIEDQYAGAKNAGRPMLLEGGMDWKQMGFSPADMGLIETKYSSARDICLAFGVPPLLLGIKGDNTFANYKEARLSFWEDTVVPTLYLLQSGLFHWLGEKYGGGIELRPELDGIPAIAEKRKELWEMADKSDDLTLNERRAIKGYEDIDGGDVILVPASMITLEQVTEPPEDTDGEEDNDDDYQDDFDDLEEVDQKMLAVINGYATKTD